MRDVQGIKLTFHDLAAFSDGELQILYVFGGILNRIQLLHAQSFGYWMTAKDESRDEHARLAAMCGIVESQIRLAGELKEAWESVQQCYYGSKVSRELNSQLPQLVQESLKRCAKHFEGTAFVPYLRNTFANHNDADEVLQVAKALSRGKPEHTVLFFEDGKYFDFSTKARLAAIAVSQDVIISRVARVR